MHDQPNDDGEPQTLSTQPSVASILKVEELLGVELEDLLRPISDESPAGPYLKSNGVYSAIREARRYDDPSLPLGVWEHDLKQADWREVERVAVEALCQKSKDLQIAIWLMEAEIHQRGFAAIAPCLVVVEQLCVSFWDSLHPKVEDDDIDFRLNPLIWADQKLLPALRLVPITASNMIERQLRWDDWERAPAVDQAKTSDPKNKELADAIDSSAFNAAWSQTRREFLLALHEQLRDGITALESVRTSVGGLCGEDPGLFPNTRQLLKDIFRKLCTHMNQRGIHAAGPERREAAGAGADDNADGVLDDGGEGGADGGGSPGGVGPIRDREDAYRRLSEAAEYLLVVEPHSPAPYLVRRAIEWGAKTTPELYQELFLQAQGQINIFNLLGLNLPD